jgi:ubiquinone/menaquinone biosynthesis C-methylase UbiE
MNARILRLKKRYENPAAPKSWSMFLTKNPVIHYLIERENDIVRNEIESLWESRNGNSLTLLDIGCGTGRFLEIFKENHTIIGVDLSINMLQHIRKKFPNSHLVIGDAENLPFRDSSVDAVLCSYLISNLNDDLDSPKSVIKNIYDVIIPEGMAIICFISKYSFEYILNRLICFINNKRPLLFFSEHDILRLLRDIDFSRKKLISYSIMTALFTKWPMPVVGFMSYIDSLWEKHIGKGGARTILIAYKHLYDTVYPESER